MEMKMKINLYFKNKEEIVKLKYENENKFLFQR